MGEKVSLVYDYTPAFNNEKLITKIYDQYGKVAATAERQMNNYSSPLVQSYTLNWDTKDYEPGKYKVVMSYEFYSYYQWHTAPNDSTRYVTLTNNIDNGAKDRNKYTGVQETFKNLSDKSATVSSNTICTAVSAWQNNNIKSAGYSIQLTEMYIGSKADEEVKNENIFNFESDDDDQWILMSFKITNNSSSELDVSDILSSNNFYKYTGTITTIFDSATFSDKRPGIYKTDALKNGESKNVWVGLRIPYSSGMPYLRVKNGTGYTFLNTNPDLLTGKKKSGHTYNSEKIITVPTCSSTGTKTFTCTDCGVTETETIAKNPSNHVGGTSIKNASAATCTSKGYTGDTYCLGCGVITVKGKEIPAKGHKYNSGEITTTPTCISGGIKTFTCINCGETKIETIANNPLNHVGETTIKDALNATCTSKGYTGDTYCLSCGVITIKGEEIPAKGHNYDSGKITIAPTCTSTGIKTFTCSICFTTKTKTLEKTPHQKKTSTDIKATLKKDGKISEKCSLCGKILNSKTISRISTVKLYKTDFAYTGKALKPKVIIKDANGKQLRLGSDYTVRYRRNKDIGKATVVVTFKGNYTGTKSISFKIIPATPKPTVTAGNKRAVIKWKAVKGADSYTVYYSASKNSGYKKIGTTAKTAYAVKNLKSGRAYYFKVVASKKVGKYYFNSSFSAPQRAIIK